MNKDRLFVLAAIPAYNEEKTIARALLFPSVFTYVVTFMKGFVNDAFVALCRRMRLFQ